MKKSLMALLLAACTSPHAANPHKRPPADDTATQVTVPVGTTPTTTTTSVDCASPPVGPLPFTIVAGDFGSAEDFDFDAAGNHVAVAAGNLTLRPQTGGAPSVIVPGLGSPINGMRSLPDGDFIIADQGSGSLRRVSTSGAIELLMASINYPNGVEVTHDGAYAFVTENANPGELWQIDLSTLDAYLLLSGIQGANGIAITANEQTIYVGTCAGTGIVALDRLGDTEWSEPRLVVDHPQGCYDAINVDACGNLYFYVTGGEMHRMLADGVTFETVADFGGKWLPNARWGSGLGGWDADTLYLNSRMDGSIVAMEVGVPGKPHVHAP